MTNPRLTGGIISVLQTPFTHTGEFDEASLVNLVEDAIAAGVDGFLVPAVASEVAYLNADERRRIVRLVAQTNQQRVALLVGASSNDPQESLTYTRLAQEAGAAACVVAVPAQLYAQPEQVVSFFQTISIHCPIPLIIQDSQFNAPGLDLQTILQLKRTLPNLVGMKIETLPAGKKYTAVREAIGLDFFIAGGWGVPQIIEALDRGVDAMIPESSMVRVYAAIDRVYRAGNRPRAVQIVRKLLPVLTFANQELIFSVAFFKRLLVRKSIFRTAYLRIPGFQWDQYDTRVADELIDLYLEIESGLRNNR